MRGCSCPWASVWLRDRQGDSCLTVHAAAVCDSVRLCGSLRVQACECWSDFFVCLCPVVTDCDSDRGMEQCVWCSSV